MAAESDMSLGDMEPEKQLLYAWGLTLGAIGKHFDNILTLFSCFQLTGPYLNSPDVVNPTHLATSEV